MVFIKQVLGDLFSIALVALVAQLVAFPPHLPNSCVRKGFSLLFMLFNNPSEK